MKFQKIFTFASFVFLQMNWIQWKPMKYLSGLFALKKRADFIVPNLLIVQKYNKKLRRSEFKRELP